VWNTPNDRPDAYVPRAPAARDDRGRHLLLRPIADLLQTTWTMKEGAPTGGRALAQTADSYLWIGPQTGLFRLDGSGSSPFPTCRGPTRPSTRALV
jgi:hypothetical protein